MDRYTGSANTPAAPAPAGPGEGRGRASARPFGTTATTYAVLTALLAGIIVWAPALGEVFLSVMAIGFASVGILLLDASRRSALGSAGKRPRTAGGWAFLAAIVAVFLAAVGASFAAVAAGQSVYCLPAAIVAFVVLAIGIAADERRETVAVP